MEENSNNNRIKGISASITFFIIVIGTLVMVSMFYLIQRNYYQAAVDHELEIMRIMKTLGCQLTDNRLSDLQTGAKTIATQYKNELIDVDTQEDGEKLLSSIDLGEDVLGYCYQRENQLYCGSQSNGDYIKKLDLSQAWRGRTIVLSPDFDNNDKYILVVATPVWNNKSKGKIDGVLIEQLDGYCVSRWMESLFRSLNFGTAYIIDDQGRNIATAKQENYDWITTRYNAQELAKESDDESTKSVAKLEKKVLEGDTGIGTYQWDGGTSYVAYGPLTEAKWGFCVGFYGDAFQEYTKEVTAVSSRTAGMLLIGFVIFIVLVVIMVMRNLNKERRYNEELVQQREEIRKQSLHIAASEERFRIAMQRSKDIIFEYQLESREVNCFYGGKEVCCGKIGDSNLGNRIIDGFAMNRDSFEELQEVISEMGSHKESGECVVRGFYKGEERWYHMSIHVVTEESGYPKKAIGIFRDVTGEREAELDSLTRLYNKSAITDYVKSLTVDNAHKAISAFAMLDVDHFKAINDVYGHPVGDKVLCSIADCINEFFPSPNVCGRFGGDEFCIFFPSDIDAKNLREKLGAFVEHIAAIHIEGLENLRVSVSIGAIVFEGNLTFDDMYQRADRILYQAKDSSEERYIVVDLTIK